MCLFHSRTAGELKTIEEVIQGIDDLLGNAPSADIGNNQFPLPHYLLQVHRLPLTSSFQVLITVVFQPFQTGRGYKLITDTARHLLNLRQNPFGWIMSLYHQIFRDKIQIGNENPVVENSADNLSIKDDLLKTSEDLIQPEQSLPSAVNSKGLLPNIDYKSAGIEELLLEVDTLELPEFEAPIVLPPAGSVSKLPEKVDTIDPTVNRDVVIRSENDPNSGEMDAVDFIVLGERIDEELRKKIREAIMSTRYASGGTDNPFVTRTVFKAVSNCNRVLGRLTAPFHKRYRRDIFYFP